jgi:diacylglycerol O-acyltransferase / wax synthase
MGWMAERLSALDASFLAVEGPDAPMHVGWVALFDPPERGRAPDFDALFEHIARRMDHAPRFRQQLAEVPLGIHDPVWVDDPDFDPRRHLLRAPDEDLDTLVDRILSSPLDRDRPLWEIWIVDSLPGGRVALVGKMHHCMVDGLAVVELGNLLLDADPGGRAEPIPLYGWMPEPAPSPAARLARAVAERTGDGAALALAPVRAASRWWRLPAEARRAAGTLAHTVLPPAPPSPLNRAGSARRHHVRLTRSLDDIRAVRRHFRVAPNDVVLAACAGGLRRYAEGRDEPVQPLKAMVPADVRSGADDAGTGNRISFVFIQLPCTEPDPVQRLRAVSRATAQRVRDREAEELDAAFRGIARTPSPIQRVLAHAFAHPRLFNLTVSSVPGPAVPRYLRGCRLRSVHSAVPLAGRHAVSIGVVMAAGNACFGITADPDTLPDADALASAIDVELDELVGRSATGPRPRAPAAARR